MEVPVCTVFLTDLEISCCQITFQFLVSTFSLEVTKNSCGRAILVEAVVVQLLSTSPTFPEAKGSLLSSQEPASNIFPYHKTQFQFMLVLPPQLPTDILPLCFQTKILHSFLISPIYVTCPTHPCKSIMTQYQESEQRMTTIY
jgi:hypothetical protein